jgi:uncharacterized membrane protein
MDSSTQSTGGTEHNGYGQQPSRQFDSPQWSTQSQSSAQPRHYWNPPNQRRMLTGNADQVANALGWFSIGLGMAELLAPRRLARLIGMSDDHRILLSLFGLREIGSGVAILANSRPANGLWSRVLGDMMDLATLGIAFKGRRSNPARLSAAVAAVAGVTALDYLSAQELSRGAQGNQSGRSIQVKKSITISRPPEEIYRFWRDFQNLPRFMKNLEEVQTTNDNRSHWVAKGPGGKKIQWDAEMIQDEPNRMISWRSLAGADVDNSGSVRFDPAPGGRGTIVRVEFHYMPPAGVLGATFAKIFGRAPEQQVHEDLHRFRQIIEAGEIITTEGQPAGRASSTSWKYDQTIRRAAQADNNNAVERNYR